MRVLYSFAVLALLALPAHATREGLWSNKYEFKPGVTLEVGAETAGALHLETVRFEIPQNAGTRTARESMVEVTIANYSDLAQRVGLAIALFDDSGRLVGVADGGTALLPLRAGHVQPYRLVFKNVNGATPSASTFQISVEAKP